LPHETAHPKQIKGIVRMVEQTSDHEFNCSECQSFVGEFAERSWPDCRWMKPCPRRASLATLPGMPRGFLALEKSCAQPLKLGG